MADEVIAVQITVENPEVTIWPNGDDGFINACTINDPNVDMVFDRPRTPITPAIDTARSIPASGYNNTNYRPPVIEVFGGWMGIGPPTQVNAFAPVPVAPTFNIQNTGIGNIEVYLVSVTYSAMAGTTSVDGWLTESNPSPTPIPSLPSTQVIAQGATWACTLTLTGTS